MEPTTFLAQGKAPILKSYAHLWETSLEESYFEPGKWNSTNVQIMTGSHWGLVVIDCDGDEAIKTWAAGYNINVDYDPAVFQQTEEED